MFVFQSAGGLTSFLRAGLNFGPRGSSEQSSSSGRSSEPASSDMKVPPISLPSGMDRLPLPLPFSPDLLWRYPNPFLAQPPPSPLETQVKSGMPGTEWNIFESSSNFSLTLQAGCLQIPGPGAEMMLSSSFNIVRRSLILRRLTWTSSR